MRYTPMQLRESFELSAQLPPVKDFPTDPELAEKALMTTMYHLIHSSFFTMRKAFPVLEHFEIDYKLAAADSDENFAKFYIPEELRPYAHQRQKIRDDINDFIKTLRFFAEDPDSIRLDHRDSEMVYTLYCKPEWLIFALSNMAGNYFEADRASYGTIYLAQHILERVEQFGAKLN